jgi:hypothetical protein
MQGQETVIVDRWLNQILSGNSRLTGIVGEQIFRHLAPPYPRDIQCAFSFQNAKGPQNLKGQSDTFRCMYNVECIARVVAMEEIEEVTSVIGELLDSQTYDDLVSIIRIVRISPISWVETVTMNNRFIHLGGNYQIWCSIKY